MAIKPVSKEQSFKQVQAPQFQSNERMINVSFTLPNELIAMVDNYKFERRLRSRSEVVRLALQELFEKA